MADPWQLSLSIDARGHDETHVGVVPGVAGASPHLKVRTGLVVVHCLGPAAAMSAAEAWATARLASARWMPPIRDPRRPQPVAHGVGAAYPSASVIFDGRQPWQVEQVGAAMTVTIGPLRVVAGDATALATHVRAWAEASALAVRLFPGRAVPFARLVEHQRVAQLRALDQAAGRARRQRRPSGPVHPPPPSERGRPGTDGGRGRG